MSLAKIRKITEQGAVFQSHIDGSRHELTPERAMDIQRLLGSDIQMQLDQCLEYPHTEKAADTGHATFAALGRRARARLSAGSRAAAVSASCRAASIRRLRRAKC